MKQTKYMKQWFFRDQAINCIVQQSQREGKQARWILWSPQLTVWRVSRPWQTGGTQTEPGSLSELRRQGWEWRKAKASIIPRAESLEESNTKRELWRAANVSLELSPDGCTQMRGPPKAGERTAERDQTRNNFMFSLARVARQCSTWGIGCSTQKGVASVVGKISSRQKIILF